MKGNTMTTLKMIDKEITSFTTNRDKLKGQAHSILMMIFRHAAPKEAGPDCMGSGDCTRALKLLKELPKSWAEQATVWLKEVTPIRVVVKNDKCEFDPKYKKLSAEEKLEWWKLEEANTTPFYDMSEEPDVKTTILDLVTLMKMVEQLGKRIETKLEKGEVDPLEVETAQDVSRRLKAFRIKHIETEAEATNDNAQVEERAA